MTQEEKAERYDEALKRTQKWYDANTNEGYRSIFKDIFPELEEIKESKDEKIRKALIKSFEIHDLRALIIPGFSAKDVIAWLKKQGEHIDFLSKIQVGDKVTRNEDGVLVNLSQLNRVAKPTYNVNTKNSEDPDCDPDHVFSKEQVEKIDKRISNLEKIYRAKLRDEMQKAADFSMTN